MSQAEQEQRTQGGKQAKQAKRTSRLDVVASFSMHVVVHQATVLLMHRQKMFAFLRTSGVDLTSSGLVWGGALHPTNLAPDQLTPLLSTSLSPNTSTPPQPQHQPQRLNASTP